MLSILMMFLGLGLVIWSLYSIRREIETGNLELTKGLSGVSDRNLEKIIYYLDELEKQMSDMNTAFYDLVSDLEGSFSIHDKEISLLTERMQKVEKQLSMLTSEVRIENHMAEVKVPSRVKAYQRPENQPHYQERQTQAAQVPTEPKPQENVAEGRGPHKIMSLSPDESQQMKQRILALRKEGHSLPQIAKILNVGIGELQLFIKLNTK